MKNNNLNSALSKCTSVKNPEVLILIEGEYYGIKGVSSRLDTAIIETYPMVTEEKATTVDEIPSEPVVKKAKVEKQSPKKAQTK